MSEDKFGLSDLVVSDDLDVSLDNDTYQDQANPAPPAAGKYLLRAVSLVPLRYRGGENKGNVVMQGGKYPKLVLEQVEIVDGLGDGITRKVGVFTEIGTQPFNRNGKLVSQLGDLARAYGLNNFSNMSEAKALLEEALANNATFAAELDWESGYDKAFVEAAREQLELPASKDAMTDDQKKLANIINYRLARVQGMKHFPFDEKRGKFSSVLTRGNVEIKHPTTGATITIEVPERTLEARAIIPVYFNDIKFISHEQVASGRVKFGPATIKVAAQAAA